MATYFVGPSDRFGGWWCGLTVAEKAIKLTGDGRQLGEAAAVWMAGWGFDRLCPLRPWPTAHVEPRLNSGVIATIVWFGFFLAVQTQSR